MKAKTKRIIGIITALAAISQFFIFLFGEWINDVACALAMSDRIRDTIPFSMVFLIPLLLAIYIFAIIKKYRKVAIIILSIWCAIWLLALSAFIPIGQTGLSRIILICWSGADNPLLKLISKLVSFNISNEISIFLGSAFFFVLFSTLLWVGIRGLKQDKGELIKEEQSEQKK